MSETKSNKDQGLTTREEMASKGKKTGKFAALTFMANGVYHVKGEEILGVDEKTMKELEAQGLVEDK